MSVNLGALGDLGDIGKQFLVWQVLGQIAQAVLGPVLVEVQQDVAGRISRVALSPADAATAVLKGYMTFAEGAKEASLNGLEGDRFQFLVDSQGEPPGLETLLEWARRGIIPWKGTGAEAVSLEQGVLESRIKPKWTGAIEAARYGVLEPGQAVAAKVRGNLPDAAALKAAEEAGVSPEHFEVMVHNAGNPPSPGELLELARRGIIPWDGVGPDVLSFQQGIYEGDSKDKWEPPMRRLGDYVPPPRTVTALLREGTINEELARTLFTWAGLSPELADAYIAAASKHTTVAAKDLTRSEVLQLYADGQLTAAQAEADLVKAGMPRDQAQELVKLQDIKRDQRLQTQVIGRIRTLYLAHHVSRQDALAALEAAGMDQATVTHLLTLWEVEATIPTERISAAQIEAAVYYEILKPEQGIAGLVSLGFSEWEAWFAIEVRLHGKTTVAPVGTPPAWAT